MSEVTAKTEAELSLSAFGKQGFCSGLEPFLSSAPLCPAAPAPCACLHLSVITESQLPKIQETGGLLKFYLTPWVHARKLDRVGGVRFVGKGSFKPNRQSREQAAGCEV